MTFSGVQAPPCSVVKCVSVCVVPIDAGGGVLKIYSVILQSHALVKDVVREIRGDDQFFTKIVLQRTLLRRVSMKPRLHWNPFCQY